MEKLFKINKKKKGVIEIILNRPELHNAFNDELILQLTEYFEILAKDKDVRLVVLTGEGKSFCAGADLNWMKRMVTYSDEENFDDSMRLAGLFDTINNFPRPVIAKINGAALGGGSGLAAACDYCIASEKAKFGFTEVRLGLVPAVISPFVVAKIGESNARAYFLSGQRISASDALRINLVHKVVTHELLDQETENIVKEFLKAAPEATGVAKKLIKDILLFEEEEGRRVYTCKTISKQRTTPEGQEGMEALLSKRLPSWQEEE